MTAGSGDWGDLSDEQRAAFKRREATWKRKSPLNKVLTYIGATLLILVVAFFGNLLLNGLCLNVGSNPCG